MNTRKDQILTLLHEQRIQYRLVEYSEPLFTIKAVAAQRGVARERLLKAILLREKKRQRFVMACVIGEACINLQAVREQLPSDWRRLTFANDEEIQTAIGYIRGTVSPLCLPKDLPVFFDIAIVQKPVVNIGSGDPSLGIELALQDLVRLARPRFAPIIKQHSHHACTSHCVLGRFHPEACTIHDRTHDSSDDRIEEIQHRQLIELQSL